MTLPTRPEWRKSSYSASQSECVEVALAPMVGVRDTKDREGGQLEVRAGAWQAFVERIN